jgi:hypothetical protein
MRGLFEAEGVDHRLHRLDAPTPSAVRGCTLEKRPEAMLTDAEFDQVTSFFIAPAPEEGFEVIRYENR